jgi:pyroglutamyl-peptidase
MLLIKRNGKAAECVILVTYFDPFGADTLNVSREVALQLPDWPFLTTVEIATSREDVQQQIPKIIQNIRPQAILSLGQASGRSMPSLERVGINLIDSRMPDNRQALYRDAAVIEGGPDAYFSTLPLRQLMDRVHNAGYPLELSLSAGTFMCNQAFYLIRHTAHGVPAGFLHLPLLLSQVQNHAGAPSMSLTDQVTIVSIIIQTIWEGISAAAEHETGSFLPH